MRIITATLVCIGKFHLFALTREPLKKGMLKRIFSGYPSWKLRAEDIPAERLKTFPWLQTPYMALGQWGLLGYGRYQRELAWHAHENPRLPCGWPIALLKAMAFLHGNR